MFGLEERTVSASSRGAQATAGRARTGVRTVALARRPDFLRLSLALLIVMVVSRVHQIFPPLAALRPGLLLSVSSAAYAFATPRALVRGNVLRHWWTRCIAFVVVQAALSGLFGISVGNSGKFMLLAFSTVLLLAGLLILAMRTTTDLVFFVAAFLAGEAALAYQTNFMFKLSTGSGLSRLAELFAFDANDVGLIFVIAVPLVASLIPVWRGRTKAALLLLLAAIGVGVARTGSRGAFLALVVVGAVMLLTNRSVAAVHRFAFAGAVAVSLLVAAPPGYFDQMMSISDPTTDYNWTSPYGRREIAKRGIGYMLAYPIFGVGVNNFRKAECTISPRVQLEQEGDGMAHCAAPHNTWVQVGAELGFPGLLAWVVMLMLPMVKLYRLSRRLPLAWRRGDEEQRFLFACANALPLSILAFAVASSFLTFAWLDIPYLLVIFAGYTWYFARRRLMADARVRSGHIHPQREPDRQ